MRIIFSNAVAAIRIKIITRPGLKYRFFSPFLPRRDLYFAEKLIRSRASGSQRFFSAPSFALLFFIFSLRFFICFISFLFFNTYLQRHSLNLSKSLRSYLRAVALKFTTNQPDVQIDTPIGLNNITCPARTRRA